MADLGSAEGGGAVPGGGVWVCRIYQDPHRHTEDAKPTGNGTEIMI